jgi:hypothetical protein
MAKILRDLEREKEYNQHAKGPEYRIIDDQVIKISDLVVYRFRMGDVEDPVLYAGQPIHAWQQTEAGKFVMEHAVESPWWVRHMDPHDYGYQFVIMARMKESDQTFFKLKYVNTDN